MVLLMNASITSIAQLTSLVSSATAKGSTFVGITYTSKSSGEVARFTVNVGTSYMNLIQKSLDILEKITFTNALEIQAKEELVASFKASLSGEGNPAYTKAGMYTTIGKGIKVLDNDESFELQGVVMSKVVIVEGTFKKVNSHPLTIAKDNIRRSLPVGKFRTFAVDVGNLHSVRVGGTELEVQ